MSVAYVIRDVFGNQLATNQRTTDSYSKTRIITAKRFAWRFLLLPSVGVLYAVAKR